MTDEQIKKYYNVALTMNDAPLSLVPTIILMSQHMDNNNTLILYTELRHNFMLELNVGKSRMSQLIKLLEQYGIIEQNIDIKIKYQIAPFVVSYEKLKERKQIRFTGTIMENNNVIIDVIEQMVGCE